MDETLWKAAFDEFRSKVRAHSGREFVSFREGLAEEWEGYKLPLRDLALSRLQAASWTADSVGTGAVLRHVISAIEIHEKPLTNNLVAWDNRYGPDKHAHRALVDAVDDARSRAAFERTFFDWFAGALDHPEAFERLASQCGRRYDLLAYLFFLRDAARFMPVRPDTFDSAFAKLGIPLVTSGKASWPNYSAYLDALRQVREALAVALRDPDVRLVDAHSFCWMLVKVEVHDDADKLGRDGRRRAMTGQARTLDARERCIAEIVNTVDKTVRASFGPSIEKQPKTKRLEMTHDELRELIAALLVEQRDVCALTGLPLQYEGPDPKLRPSLDRIDSEGHYSRGNLQVVCRFVNFWKGSETDEEFRRLLGLLRNEL